MRSGLGILALGVIVMLAACSDMDSESTAASEAPVLEVFGNYRDRQADDFRLVLDEFTERTGLRVSYVGTADVATRIQERIRDGDPPDVVVLPQPAILADLARRGFVMPLDDRTAAAVARNYPETARHVTDVDGVDHGVWYRASLKSLVWYPPARFEEGGYGIPARWSDLLELSSRMVDDGEVPWCLGMESFGATGWVGTDWVEDLVLRLHGVEVYDAWTAGEIPFTDERIAEAFEEFGQIALRPQWVNGGPNGVLTVPAMTAILPMLDQPPGCLMSRQASFQVLDLPDTVEIGPDGDLDFFVLPGTTVDEAPLLVSGEIAATLTGTDEAFELLRFLATPESGEPWAAMGGYTSPHLGFDPALYASDFDRRIATLIGEADVLRFDGSDLMDPAVGTGTFWAGMVDFVAGMGLDDVLVEIEAGYGE